MIIKAPRATITAHVHFNNLAVFVLHDSFSSVEADSPIFLSSTATESCFTLAESRSTVILSALSRIWARALALVLSVTFSNRKVSPTSLVVIVMVFVSNSVSCTSTKTTSLTVSLTSTLVAVVRLLTSVAFRLLAQAVKHRTVVTMRAAVDLLNRIAQLGYLVL